MRGGIRTQRVCAADGCPFLAHHAATTSITSQRHMNEEADMFRVCGRRVLPRHVARIGAFVFALTLIGAQHAAAQAVYGSIAGTVTDESAAVLPGVTVTVTSLERKTVDTVRHERIGPLLEGAAAARQLRGQGRALRVQDDGRAVGAGERRYPDADQSEAGRGSTYRDGRGHRRIAAPQDRSRRRLDHLRSAAADRSARARPELHQVHPAHARRAAAPVAARGL